MAQSLVNQGRSNVPVPARGYDTVIDGGASLEIAINAAFAQLSNQDVTRWSGDITLANNASTTYTHNFTQSLANLKVLIAESGVILTNAQRVASYTISSANTASIAVQNVSGGSKTFQIYILAFPLGVVSADLDASIDATVTRLRFTGGLLIDEISTPATPSSGQAALYFKADRKLYKKDSTGAEAEVGAVLTNINYILNGDFETGAVTGWALYNDGASAVPTDGTGGATNVTLSASSSSPLRGSFSALFTKGAVNYQGQGCSYAFTIDSIDTAQTLELTMDTSLSSDFAVGDIVPYVYDVTNTTLITPSQVSISAGNAGQWRISFLSTTSLSYRLIFHVATTNALAYTMKFDNMKLAPYVGNNPHLELVSRAVAPSNPASGKVRLYQKTSDGLVHTLNSAGTDTIIADTSTAQTLTNKTLTTPIISAPTGIVKGDVGLGNVDNTSDSTKNGATATLTNKSFDSTTIIKAANELRFNNAADTFYSSIKGGNNSSNLNLTLPITAPLANQLLGASDILGNMAWFNQASGGGSSGNVAANDSNVVFTSADASTQICNPTAARTYTLPSTGISAGDTWTFINQSTTAAAIITIQSSGSNTISYCLPTGRLVLTALVSTPTTAANWLIVDANSKWIAYTPTITGIGTPSGVAWYYRRDKNTMEIKGKHVNGTLNAANYSFTLGGGFTLDTSVISGTTQYGIQIRGLASANANLYAAFAITGTSTSVLFINYLTNGTYSPDVPNVTANMMGSGETHYVDVKGIPIALW